MPEKNIADVIQNILDEHRGFVTVRSLPSFMSPELRFELGLKTGLRATVVRRKIEPLLEDRFIFHSKGRALYILTPCDSSELVIAILSEKKPKSPKDIARRLPLIKSDVQKIINSLVEEGRAKIILNEALDARVLLLPLREIETVKVSVPSLPGECTEAKFRAAFDELNNGRIFVRICDLRRKLGWPREVFDDMLRNLRDREIVQLHVGDASTMTPEEVQDSFMDENNFRMGSVTWHVR